MKPKLCSRTSLCKFQRTAVNDEAEPEFKQQAGAVLENAGIDVAKQIQQGQDAPGVPGGHSNPDWGSF